MHYAYRLCSHSSALPPLPPLKSYNDDMKSLYRQARFLVAAAHPKQFPEDQGWEVAFAGRSNAGKSSVINRLCEQKALARTSKTPGRTQQIIFFQLDDTRRLVDLPGYGYAKAPPGEKAAWARVIERYLNERRALQGIVLVVDARHPGKPFDIQMLQWCAHSGLPALVLLNKADKLKRGALAQAQRDMKRLVDELGAEAEVIPFSALRGEGTEAAKAWLDRQLGGTAEAEE